MGFSKDDSTWLFCAVLEVRRVERIGAVDFNTPTELGNEIRPKIDQALDHHLAKLSGEGGACCAVDGYVSTVPGATFTAPGLLNLKEDEIQKMRDDRREEQQRGRRPAMKVDAETQKIWEKLKAECGKASWQDRFAALQVHPLAGRVGGWWSVLQVRLTRINRLQVPVKIIIIICLVQH